MTKKSRPCRPCYDTCGNCKHFRKKKVTDRDGTVLALGYCHAIWTEPYRHPDLPPCKKWSAIPDKI